MNRFDLLLGKKPPAPEPKPPPISYEEQVKWWSSNPKIYRRQIMIPAGVPPEVIAQYRIRVEETILSHARDDGCFKFEWQNHFSDPTGEQVLQCQLDLSTSEVPLLQSRQYYTAQRALLEDRASILSLYGGSYDMRNRE